MTVLELLKKYPEDETELFLSHLLKWSKDQLYLHPEKQLTQLQQKRLRGYISEFRKGMPVAYIFGFKYFYGLKFKVTKDTLIPRPETEWIIDKTISIVRACREKNDSRLDSPSKSRSNNTFSILDVGTGSGCIAITLKTLLPNVKITAVDISAKALKVAKQNARKHLTNIKFEQANLLPNKAQTFDIVIANLPYVPRAVYKKNFWNLKYEPKLALLDPNRNGSLYLNLLQALKANPPRYLILEIDPALQELLKRSCKKYFPTAHITFEKDLHKLIRYCTIDFKFKK